MGPGHSHRSVAATPRLFASNDDAAKKIEEWTRPDAIGVRARAGFAGLSSAERDRTAPRAPPEGRGSRRRGRGDRAASKRRGARRRDLLAPGHAVEGAR